MISRRKLLAIGSAGVSIGLRGDIARRSPTRPTPTPRTRFGALVQLPDESTSLASWRADIDAMVAEGQTLVRCGPSTWLIAPARGQWSSSWTASCQEALDYAIARGLKINMVLPGCPDWAQGLGFAEYHEACKAFWSGMRERFGSRTDLVQIFNEADGSHYRYYTAVEVTPDYLDELAMLLASAHEIFAAPGPGGVPVTTNLLGWPMNDLREQRWYQVLDVLAPQLDVVSLDTYPADNWDEINTLPTRVKRVQQRYRKPIFIAEVGLQTAGAWDAADQAIYVCGAIDALKSAKPWGICLYRWRDSAVDHFGLQHLDRSPKSGYAAVLRAMRN